MDEAKPVPSVEVSPTFGVHVQAAGLAAVVGSHVVVADGDVEGVTARDVVTQRLPVHRYQTGPGLRDLQTLRSPHGFCAGGRGKNTESCVSKARQKA